MSRMYGLAFEVKAIQPAITEGGRLRDLVGASELIDYLCRPRGEDLLGEVIAALQIPETELVWARRAGAAFRVFSADRAALVRLRALWTLLLKSALPGLEVVSAIVDEDDQAAIGARIAGALAAARAQPHVLLPVVGPFVRRAPRTGRPAERVDKVTKEPVDRLTGQKRKVTDKKTPALALEGLTRRFLPKAGNERLCWPTTFEPETGQVTFPLLGDNSHIAVVHADGNGLGQHLIRLERALHDRYRDGRAADPDYGRSFFAFSEAIAAATEAAVAEAVRRVLVPAAYRGDGTLPARPILLGGDDLTLIVRGDLAIPFTALFLDRFAVETRQHIGRLREQPGVLADCLGEVEGLTAGAGIAFIKASQPFYLGLELAGDLAKFAKGVAKSIGAPSSVLAFHRVTTTLVDSYETLVERELAIEDDGAARRLTMQPYAVRDGSGLPPVTALEDLTEWLTPAGDEKSSRAGKLRDIAGLWPRDAQEARRRYGRWHQVTSASDEGKAIGELATILEALQVEGFGAASPGFGAERTVGAGTLPQGTPVVDALSWAAVRAGAEGVPSVRSLLEGAPADG